MVDVEEGKSLNISCEVKSQYASEVTWHFSKAGVDPGDVVGLSNRISQVIVSPHCGMSWSMIGGHRSNF